MEIMPFKPEHLNGLDWQSLTEGSMLGAMPEGWRRGALARAAAGWAFSGFEQGQWLGAAGLLPWWPGVAEAWLLLAPAGRKVPLAAVRALKKGLETLIQTMRVHRLQASVRADFGQARKMAEVLGFHEESRMAKYGPDGADYLRYVRLT